MQPRIRAKSLIEPACTARGGPYQLALSMRVSPPRPPQDSDLTGVVDLRYTGGARMLLMLELGERGVKGAERGNACRCSRRRDGGR